MAIRVTFHKSNSNEWVWTVQAANYKIIGYSSESYKNKADAVSNFEQLTGRSVKGMGVVLEGVENKIDGVALVLNNASNESWDVIYQ